MAILILDTSEKFPNIDSILESKFKLSSPEVSTQFLNYPVEKETLRSCLGSISERTDFLTNLTDYLTESSVEHVFIFSYDFEKLELFTKLAEDSIPLFKFYTKSEFKDLYETLRSDGDRDKFLPKVKISSDKPLDLLSLSDLFRVNKSKTLKYINGSSTPVLIPYEGMETFEQLSSLKSGILVPATDLDLNNESSEKLGELNDNCKYILQYVTEDEIEGFSYTVRMNNDYGIVWTDIKSGIQFPEIESYLSPKLDSDLVCYVELEKHKDQFYISKINQGVHPYYKFKKDM